MLNIVPLIRTALQFHNEYRAPNEARFLSTIAQ